jgi:glycosyltransferase involved in cell wall biosynthesis
VTYATHLHERGHSLAVVLLYPPAHTDQYYERLRRAGVHVETIAPSRGSRVALDALRSLAQSLSGVVRLPRNARRLSRVIWRAITRCFALAHRKRCHNYFRCSDADLIHAMTPDAGAELMIRAGAAAGIPVLYQELGTPHPMHELESHYKRFVKVLPLCSEVAALSPLLARQWRARLDPANNVSVLPLLVEDRGAKGGEKVQRADCVTFGFAARLEVGKGPLIMIEAFARARREHSGIRLRIAGTGPLEQAIRERAAALGVADACDFTGAYTSLEEGEAFMQSLDVFLLPTFAEGTPNSIIEAMAHGLPVVASAVGGIPDLITSETGILVPPGDRDTLAAAIASLASDPDRRAQLGRAARDRYVQLFSPQSVLPALADTYRRVAALNFDGATHAQDFTHPWLQDAPA